MIKKIIFNNVIPRCYKVTHNISKENPTFVRQFKIKFQKAFETKSIPKMSIYFTLEPNVYHSEQMGRWQSIQDRFVNWAIQANWYLSRKAKSPNVLQRNHSMNVLHLMWSSWILMVVQENAFLCHCLRTLEETKFQFAPIR